MTFNNKKGVSEVVANVLIVLLVIVGVAVIWSVVQSTIDKSAREIKTECFNVKASPVSCTPSTTNGIYDVIVKRDSGAGSFQEFKVILEDDRGATQIFSVGGPTVQELETVTETLTTIGTFTASKMKVAVVVGSNPAEVRTCEVFAAPIVCA